MQNENGKIMRDSRKGIWVISQCDLSFILLFLVQAMGGRLHRYSLGA